MRDDYGLPPTYEQAVGLIEAYPWSDDHTGDLRRSIMEDLVAATYHPAEWAGHGICPPWADEAPIYFGQEERVLLGLKRLGLLLMDGDDPRRASSWIVRFDQIVETVSSLDGDALQVGGR